MAHCATTCRRLGTTGLDDCMMRSCPVHVVVGQGQAMACGCRVSWRLMMPGFPPEINSLNSSTRVLIPLAFQDTNVRLGILLLR
ncbi:hypothetical protein TNCT_603031 [Trichonephila clavata]|uniref:Uncharacterized protein n=1 Tax=Trichonephila clavata TaxID=2740835 RepID=A0A8X6J599_TRICU|nr:hypothetical protein TNCT_603031 [Trichonephila clavata]